MSAHITVMQLARSLAEHSKPDWLVERYVVKILHPGEGSTTLASKEGAAFVDGWHLTADELPDDGIAVLCYTDDNFDIAYLNTEDGEWFNATTDLYMPSPRWWTDLPWAPE